MISAHYPGQDQSFTFLQYPELDQPKQTCGLHMTIGFLKTPEPFSSNQERERFNEGLSQIMSGDIGQALIQRAWLVHYANRTLNRIIGKVALDSGNHNALTAQGLLTRPGLVSETSSSL